MRKSRYSEDQIAFALHQGDGGTPVGYVCRRLRVCAVHIAFRALRRI